MIGIYRTPGREQKTEILDTINAVVSHLAELANLTPAQCDRLIRWCFINLGFDENGQQTYCVIENQSPITSHQSPSTIH